MALWLQRHFDNVSGWVEIPQWASSNNSGWSLSASYTVLISVCANLGPELNCLAQEAGWELFSTLLLLLFSSAIHKQQTNTDCWSRPQLLACPICPICTLEGSWIFHPGWCYPPFDNDQSSSNLVGAGTRLFPFDRWKQGPNKIEFPDRKQQIPDSNTSNLNLDPVSSCLKSENDGNFEAKKLNNLLSCLLLSTMLISKLFVRRKFMHSL